MILDAGVFIGLDNPSKARIIVEVVRRKRARGEVMHTNETVLAQAWRSPSQVAMNRLVGIATVHPFGDPRAIGMLCASVGTSDVVDASLAILSRMLGDMEVLTTDSDDMAKLGVPHHVL